jgi:hypothetical protein
MLSAQNDQFIQALFGKAESAIIVSAILILVVGIPLYWLRLKAERALIRVIRSSRDKRQAQKSAANTDSFETVPHCPVCNALMVKRFARRGVSAGSNLLGLQQLSQVSRHESGLISLRSRCLFFAGVREAESLKAD